MFKELIKRIEANEKIAIYRHSDPDGDAAGSSFGLKELIKLNYPNKDVRVISSDSNELVDLLFPQADSFDEAFIDGALQIVTDTANTERISGEVNAEKSIKIDHHPNEEPFGDLMIVDPTYSSASELVTHIAVESG